MVVVCPPVDNHPLGLWSHQHNNSESPGEGFCSASTSMFVWHLEGPLFSLLHCFFEIQPFSLLPSSLSPAASEVVGVTVQPHPLPLRRMCLCLWCDVRLKPKVRPVPFPPFLADGTGLSFSVVATQPDVSCESARRGSIYSPTFLPTRLLLLLCHAIPLFFSLSSHSVSPCHLSLLLCLSDHNDVHTRLPRPNVSLCIRASAELLASKVTYTLLAIVRVEARYLRVCVCV